MELTFVQILFLIIFYFLLISFGLFLISEAVFTFLKVKRMIRKE